MTLPYVATDLPAGQERQHRTLIANTTNELVKVRPPHDTTPLEVDAEIRPKNFSYPVGNVMRYGAVGDGVANDYQAIRDGIDALGAQGGVLFFPPGVYRVDNATIDIETMVVLDGGCSNNGGASTGAVLLTTTNLPLLRYPNTANRFVTLRDITLVGDRAAGSAQFLLVIDNFGVHVHNVRFRNAGADAILGLRSVGAQFSDIYSSLNKRSSFHIASSVASWGANVWTNCNGAADDETIWDIEQADGADTLIGCAGEQSVNGYGIRFGADVLRWAFIRHYSELNDAGTILFDADSNYNHVNFQTRSSSVAEAEPVNNGGIDNTWNGIRYVSPGVFSVIKPKLIDHSTVEYGDVAIAAPNAIPFDNSAPQASGEGATMMSASVTIKRAGNKIHVTGVAEVSTDAGAYIIAAAFIGAATDAISVKAVNCATGVLVSVPIDFWYTTTAAGSLSVAINIGSNAAANITLNGVGGTRVFATTSKSVLNIFEYEP